MYRDILFCRGNKELEKFGKELGFSKLFFKDDFKKLGLVISKDYHTDRKLVEGKRIKILVNSHVNPFRDSLHQRVSGLDHVLCKLLNKNKIAVGFSLDSLDNPVVLGRIKQNIKLCRKYKVKILFFSFAKSKYEMRSVLDMISLCRVLGMTGKEAKESFS